MKNGKMHCKQLAVWHKWRCSLPEKVVKQLEGDFFSINKKSVLSACQSKI
jgi:hypothetical protein